MTRNFLTAFSSYKTGRIGIGLALTLALTGSVQAQVSSWIGGPDQTDFTNAANWTQGIPSENDIAAIGPDVNAQNSDVMLDDDHNLGGVLITDGMTLRTAQNQLGVYNLNGGGLTIAGSNQLPNNMTRRSRLVIEGSGGPDGTLNSHGNFRVLEGAALQLTSGARLRVFENYSLTNSSDSLIVGDGAISLSDAGQQTLNNNGTIKSSDFGQLTLSSNGIADFDGDNETGVLDASALASTLTLLSTTNESFDGTIRIGTSSTVDFESDGGGWDFGTATIEFNSTSEQAASRFNYSDDSIVGGTQLQVSGHGLVGDENDMGSSLTGTAHLNLADNASLKFENTQASLTGSWTIGNKAVLDFQDRLVSANSIAAVLTGGTIQGEGSAVFNNTDQEGIRGFGRFELPVSNSMSITADGGELVIARTDYGVLNPNDWDGIYDIGQLQAEAGNLRLIDNFSGKTQGDVRVGGGHTLFVDGFRMQFDGHVMLNGGTIASEQAQLFRGSIDVTRQSTIDAFAGFQEGVAVELQADLQLTGHTSFIDNTAMFSGPGDLINESTNRLGFDDGSFVDVDVINHGIMGNENVEAPGIVSLGGRLDNFGTVVFALGGLDDLTHFDIAGDLLAEDGIFRVSLVNDFDPMLGDEFDFLDFGLFINNGFDLDLPGLQPGLAWDSSEFTSQGILRINAVPEPSAAILWVLGAFGLIARRRRN